MLDVEASPYLTFARFVPPSIAEKYDLDTPEYPGLDQVVELPVNN